MPEPRRFELPNGLDVVLQPMPGLSTVGYALAVRSGIAQEENWQSGMSDYLRYLLEEQAAFGEAYQVGDKLFWQDAHYRVEALPDGLTVSMRMAPQQEAYAFWLLSGLLTHTLQAVGEETYFHWSDNYRLLQWPRMAGAALRADHPYHSVMREVQDPEEGREAARAFIGRHWVANRATLVVTGPMDTARLRPLIEKAFGEAIAGEPFQPEAAVAEGSVVSEEPQRMAMASKEGGSAMHMVWAMPPKEGVAATEFRPFVAWLQTFGFGPEIERQWAEVGVDSMKIDFEAARHAHLIRMSLYGSEDAAWEAVLVHLRMLVDEWREEFPRRAEQEAPLAWKIHQLRQRHQGPQSMARALAAEALSGGSAAAPERDGRADRPVRLSALRSAFRKTFGTETELQIQVNFSMDAPLYKPQPYPQDAVSTRQPGRFRLSPLTSPLSTPPKTDVDKPGNAAALEASGAGYRIGEQERHAGPGLGTVFRQKGEMPQAQWHRWKSLAGHAVLDPLGESRLSTYRGPLRLSATPDYLLAWSPLNHDLATQYLGYLQGDEREASGQHPQLMLRTDRLQDERYGNYPKWKGLFGGWRALQNDPRKNPNEQQFARARQMLRPAVLASQEEALAAAKDHPVFSGGQAGARNLTDESLSEAQVPYPKDAQPLRLPRGKLIYQTHSTVPTSFRMAFSLPGLAEGEEKFAAGWLLARRLGRQSEKQRLGLSAQWQPGRDSSLLVVAVEQAGTLTEKRWYAIYQLLAVSSDWAGVPAAAQRNLAALWPNRYQSFAKRFRDAAFELHTGRSMQDVLKDGLGSLSDDTMAAIRNTIAPGKAQLWLTGRQPEVQRLVGIVPLPAVPLSEIVF